MGSRGVVPGDVPALDSKRRAMAAAARRGDYRAAQRDAEAALALLSRVNVDKAFVGNKLQRFNVRYDKIKDVSLRAKLKDVLKTVSIAYSQGSFADANRALNQAFAMMGR
jgi:hypothetical protein